MLRNTVQSQDKFKQKVKEKLYCYNFHDTCNMRTTCTEVYIATVNWTVNLLFYDVLIIGMIGYSS